MNSRREPIQKIVKKKSENKNLDVDVSTEGNHKTWRLTILRLGCHIHSLRKNQSLKTKSLLFFFKTHKQTKKTHRN